jgi:hypothetical protein
MTTLPTIKRSNSWLKCRTANGEPDKVIAYNELSNIIENQHNKELHEPDSATYSFKAINDHQGPLKGSFYNVLVHWEDGLETFEPLTVMAKADPLTCALHAKTHALLDTPGWKSLKRIATREVKFTRMVKQAQLSQARHGPTYKFGILVPKNRKDALAIDHTSGNNRWQVSKDTESNKSMNMIPSETLERGDRHLATMQKYVSTLSMTSSMICDSRVALLLREI